MSDEQNTKSVELEEAKALDESKAATTPAESEPAGSNSSNSSENVKLNEGSTASVKQETPVDYAETIAKSWADKIAKDPDKFGELTEKQPWLVSKVNALLGKSTETKPAVDVDARIKAFKVTEQFVKDKEFLHSLPKELQDSIIQESNDSKAEGTSIESGLALALKRNAERIEKELGHAHNRKVGTTLPNPSRSSNSQGSLTPQDVINMSDEEYEKLMEKKGTTMVID